MSHGHTKISSTGVCIYCGRGDVKLTDEHVVPFSLGGQHVLVEASCLRCADITKKFEQKVARNLWGDARASYNAPTRRKKEREKRIYLRDPTGINPDLEVSPGDYPAPMVFYQMQRAGVLCGDPEHLDRSGNWKLITIVDEPRLRDFVSKHPDRLTAQFTHVPDSFARLLAKIGYCQVLTSLAPSDFNAVCLPYILGNKSNLSYIVGSRLTNEEPEKGVGYRLSSHRFGTKNKQVLVSEIRLVADNHTPTYHVVVGYVTGEDRVRAVAEKLEARYAVDMPEQFDSPREPPHELHWMPSIWPLPFFAPASESS
jgi:hypothetical protein